jgi:hypothetical protein
VQAAGGRGRKSSGFVHYHPPLAPTVRDIVWCVAAAYGSAHGTNTTACAAVICLEEAVGRADVTRLVFFLPQAGGYKGALPEFIFRDERTSEQGASVVSGGLCLSVSCCFRWDQLICSWLPCSLASGREHSLRRWLCKGSSVIGQLRACTHRLCKLCSTYWLVRALPIWFPAGELHSV